MPPSGSGKGSDRIDWTKFLRDEEVSEYEHLRREAKRLDARRKGVTSKIAVLRQRCAKRREVAEKKGNAPPAVAVHESDGYIDHGEDKEGIQ
jgi:hypothetical protein